MNNVNLTGVIRNSGTANFGQSTVGIANLDMGKKLIPMVFLGGNFPEDGTEVFIDGQLPSEFFIKSSSKLPFKVELVPDVQRRLVTVFAFDVLGAATPMNDEKEQPVKKNNSVKLAKVRVEDLGDDFIVLDGETYRFSEKPTFRLVPAIGMDVRAYYVISDSGEKLCTGTYSLENNDDTNGSTGGNGHSGKEGNSDKVKPTSELKNALVTGGTEKGIFIDGLFYTRTKNTTGMKELPKRGDIVNAKVTSTDPSDGVKRYLLSVYPSKQQQSA